MPKTKYGKWAVWSLVAFALLFGLFQIVIASGQKGGEEYFSNLWLAVPITLAGVSGIVAFLFGGICLIRNLERSFLIWLATGIGFLVLVFVLGELFGSH